MQFQQVRHGKSDSLCLGHWGRGEFGQRGAAAASLAPQFAKKKSARSVDRWVQGRAVAPAARRVGPCDGFAAANGHDEKNDDEIRAELGEKFPKHIYRSIICIGGSVGTEGPQHGHKGKPAIMGLLFFPGNRDTFQEKQGGD